LSCFHLPLRRYATLRYALRPILYSFDEEAPELHRITPLNGAFQTEKRSHIGPIWPGANFERLNGQTNLKPPKLLLLYKLAVRSQQVELRTRSPIPNFFFISTLSHASLAFAAAGFFGGCSCVRAFDLATTVNSTASGTTTGAASGIRGQARLQHDTS
jgi:hypothetical protein